MHSHRSPVFAVRCSVSYFHTGSGHCCLLQRPGVRRRQWEGCAVQIGQQSCPARIGGASKRRIHFKTGADPGREQTCRMPNCITYYAPPLGSNPIGSSLSPGVDYTIVMDGTRGPVGDPLKIAVVSNLSSLQSIQMIICKQLVLSRSLEAL